MREKLESQSTESEASSSTDHHRKWQNLGNVFSRKRLSMKSMSNDSLATKSDAPSSSGAALTASRPNESSDLLCRKPNARLSSWFGSNQTLKSEFEYDPSLINPRSHTALMRASRTSSASLVKSHTGEVHTSIRKPSREMRTICRDVRQQFNGPQDQAREPSGSRPGIQREAPTPSPEGPTPMVPKRVREHRLKPVEAFKPVKAKSVKAEPVKTKHVNALEPSSQLDAHNEHRETILVKIPEKSSLRNRMSAVFTRIRFDEEGEPKSRRARLFRFKSNGGSNKVNPEENPKSSKIPPPLPPRPMTQTKYRETFQFSRSSLIFLAPLITVPDKGVTLTIPREPRRIEPEIEEIYQAYSGSTWI